MERYALSNEIMMARLAIPSQNPLPVFIDTDTSNEIDDPFAIVYALLSPEIDACGIASAPFRHEKSRNPAGGIEKSCRRIKEILSLLGKTGVPVHKGASSFLFSSEAPVLSEASEAIASAARRQPPDEPLYVVSIGALTNIASALLTDSRIIDKIVVIWLGGHAFHWPDTKEFNLLQDQSAFETVMASGVPLMIVPCFGAASHLQTTLPEIREHVLPCGKLGQFLYDIYVKCSSDHFGYARVLWDMAPFAFLANPEWTLHRLAHCPRLTRDLRWSTHDKTRLVRYIYHIDRNAVFTDLFRKIRRFSGS
ncbi:nucleoside hydrolase [Paenibacillus hamazuiensis]|uniref:nucleoside hydrolase n=1 Tax=Paenibacillus hamazuiensis TaxID=2936508 RepID=UPI00200CABC6|nr:nucleoside hydrolase [Paenibacillus hamazuiensis]